MEWIKWVDSFAYCDSFVFSREVKSTSPLGKQTLGTCNPYFIVTRLFLTGIELIVINICRLLL